MKILLTIKDDTHRRLKFATANERVSVTRKVNELIEDYVATCASEHDDELAALLVSLETRGGRAKKKLT
jgi:hypothetical protein